MSFASRQLLSCCLFFPLAALAQTKRVAVYDFDYSAVKGDVTQVYGSDKPVGAQVANRIIAKLVGSNASFDVIDRNQIDRILKEQNFKFSDRFDPRDAPKLGKLLNVDAIVTGTVDQIAGEVQNNRVGVGPLGVGKVEAVAEVTVSVRVISTETGKIFLAEQVNNKQTHNLGKGGRLGNKVGGDGGTVNAHPEAMAANSAIQGAADEIAAKIVAKADQLPLRTGGATSSAKRQQQAPPPVDSAPAAVSSTGLASRSAEPVSLKVGRIEGSKIFITGGENAGLKVNDQLEVRHVTGSMKDDQGNVIETDERVETVVVVDVSDRFAEAKPLRGTTTAAQVGDKLRRVKASTTRKGAVARPGNAVLPAAHQAK